MADIIVRALEAIPRPENESEDFYEGFEEFRRLAVAMFQGRGTNP